MKKDEMVYVGHMLDMARAAVARVEGLSREAFDQDEDLRLALAHRIQSIGEAAVQVSSLFRDAHPEVPWHAIVGMRHKIVHEYLDINFDIVWTVATTRLPMLIEQLEIILPAP